MKRTVSIIISMMCVASALMLTACDSNSNGSNANTALEQLQMNDPIVGTWQLNSIKITIYSEGVVQEEKGPYNSIGGIEFNNDGSYTRHLGSGESLNGEWSLLDETPDRYYSLYSEYTDYLPSQFKFEATEYAPATHIAELIDSQTLETQENAYFESGEDKFEVEITTWFERIK